MFLFSFYMNIDCLFSPVATHRYIAIKNITWLLSSFYVIYHVAIEKEYSLYIHKGILQNLTLTFCFNKNIY